MSSHLFQQNSYGSQPYGNEPLAFFGGPGPSAPSSSSSPYYAGSRPSIDERMGGAGSTSYATGTMASSARLGSMMGSGEGRWWQAFGTGGFEGEPSLMEGEGIT